MLSWVHRHHRQVPSAGAAAASHHLTSSSQPSMQTHDWGPPPAYEAPPPYTPFNRPQKQKTETGQQDALRKIPQSVLLRIAYHLPPESQTALALVNKRTLNCISLSPMSAKARHTFLQLLDRDLSLLVYCTVCKIIHRPLLREDRQCRDLHTRANDRAGVKRNDYTFLEFNYIHAIMREYRVRRDCSKLLQLPCFKEGRDSIETELHRGISADYIKIIPEANSDTFLFMTQKVFPVAAARGWRYSIRNMYELGYFVKQTSRICEHRHWDMEYEFLLPDMEELANKTGYYYLTGSMKTFVSFAASPRRFRRSTSTPSNVARVGDSLDQRLYCAVTHPLGSSQACCQIDIQQGVVRSCGWCDTDFCFTVVRQNVPGRGNELFWVFTSWKNLGSGVDRNDPAWRAHTRARGDSVQFPRSKPPLWTYSQFGLADENSDEYWKVVYKPKLREETILAARADEY
ncbi:hypothetical protein B0T25DRAFT_60894 [Lasiosphaeria hispida]|uniref:F-box domain-containing protein n=1 Tax=Lasiosphaeria hispida TaxID=260671 RepID=A0AAJ0MKY5_9PEZI|nr:hypothetical protein B0T25DRAFT_60894 [Lasiosphaeria hispida]